MRRSSFAAAAATLAVLLLSSCSSGPKLADRPTDLPAGFPNHSLTEIRQHIAQPTDTLRTFEAKAQLSIKSPARSGRFGSTVRHRRGDSLYLSISPGLGIEAARALVTPDSFFVYDRINNTLTYGALEDAGRQLPAPLTQGQTFENFLGILAPEAATDWAVTADSARYVLTDPSGRRTVTVDPALWRVTRYEERAADGSLAEERVFSDFDRFSGLYLPRRVVLRRPGDEATASIYYRDLTLNPGGLAFGLGVRSSADRELVSR